jgi:hypothetical protein
VKVPPVELDGSRPKEIPGMSREAEAASGASSELIGHNESELQINEHRKKYNQRDEPIPTL